MSARDDYEKSRLEYQLVNDVLTRIEHAERDALSAMGCPTDVVTLYAILSGEQRAPWPRRTAARDRQRVLHAMHVLVKISETRRHLAIGQENSRRASYAALFVGLHANGASLDAAFGVKGKMQRRIAGKASAAKRPKADRHDAAILNHLNTWILSESLQDRYASKAAYIEAKTGLNRRTIQRRIKALIPRQ